jgi:hypothetical protein
MGLFDNQIKLGTALVIGVGAFLVAPLVMSAVTGVARPLAKAGIRGGMLLYAKTKELIAEAGEVIEDLAVEVKADLAAEAANAAAVAGPHEEITTNAS